MKIRKVRRSRSRSFTIPLAIVAGLFLPIKQIIVNQPKEYWIARTFLGYDTIAKRMNTASIQQSLKEGYLPIAVGMSAHWLASKFGLNRMLGRMGVPVVRI